MNTSLRCLIVEDSEDDALLMLRELRAGGYDITSERVDTPEAMRAALERQTWDIVLSDYKMPRFSGMAALALLKGSGLDVPCIIVSGTIGEELAVAAMKRGAHDYFIKGQLKLLPSAVERELREAEERRQRRRSEEQLSEIRWLLAETGKIGRVGGWEFNIDTQRQTWTEEVYLIHELDLSCQPTVDAGLNFYTPESRPIIARAVQRAIELGEPFDLELEIITAKGNRRAVQAIGKVDLPNRKVVGFFQDITERKQAEAALRLNTIALTAAANSIVITDRTGTIVWANPAFTSLTGYTVEEVAGKNPRELLKSGRHEPAFYQQMWETILAGNVWRGELVNRRRDGSLYSEEMTITPVRAGGVGGVGGAITHFIAMKQDLTERKQAEKTLQESEQLLADAQSMASLGSYVLHIASGRWRSTAALDAVLGIDATYDRSVEGWVALIHPDDRAMMADYFSHEVVSQGQTFHKEYRIIRRRDQTERWVLGLGQLERDAQGQPVRMKGAIQDITERKQAQTALRQSEENYRLLFDNNPFPLWLYDLETLQFLAVNKSAVQQYGYTREEFLAMTIKDIRPATEIPALLVSVREGRARGHEYSEWLHRRKDGTIIRVEIFSRPFVFHGRAARLVIASDITEKRQIQEKYLQTQRLESVGMLAAGIAHDLNNVLAPIIFATPMLRENLTTPRDTRMLEAIEKSAMRGAGLVKQILGFVRTTTSEFQPTQVKHLARDVVSVIEETFPKSIRCDHQIPTDLWPVQGNATQIHQVLLNLCVNARDAMPAGGTLRLAIANRQLDAVEAAAIPGARPGAWLALEVGDTGTGIPPEVLEKIWTPFFTTKAAGLGTGLGLSTVRSITMSHQGFIDLRTSVGQGTTITIYLPASTGEADRSVSAAPMEIPAGHGERILVVDDEAAIRDTVTAILAEYGYDPVGCADGMEAIGLFSAQPRAFSLVITDVDMPRLGGLELAQALLQLRPEIRILAMSGLSGRRTESSDIPTIRTLAHAYLQKPFKTAELLVAVHALLQPAAKI